MIPQLIDDMMLHVQRAYEEIWKKELSPRMSLTLAKKAATLWMDQVPPICPLCAAARVVFDEFDELIPKESQEDQKEDPGFSFGSLM